MHQSSLDLDAPRRHLIGGDDAGGSGDEEQPDRRGLQQLDHRHALLCIASHHRLQQRRLASAAFAVVESLPEA